MISRVISGGQTGADMGGLLAAKAADIPTGGWAPKGWVTEYGSFPGLADFGLREHASPGYPPRTAANVKEATGLIWFGNPYSPGGKLTLGLCHTHSVPYYTAVNRTLIPRSVADWIAGHVIEGETKPVVLMIAGNRESGSPGLALYVEKFLGEVFALLSRQR